ncbi:hypothetical protein REPUB_Repub16aG0040700 [Reevesia pubescens]
MKDRSFFVSTISNHQGGRHGEALILVEDFMDAHSTRYFFHVYGLILAFVCV